MAKQSIFGYFEVAGQVVPSYDPGLTCPCPICLRQLREWPTKFGEQFKTISLMKEGDDRSYFFRAHKRCWDNASEEEKNNIEHSLIDSKGNVSTT